MPHTPTSERIASNVRAEMARRRITQTEIAKKAGIPQSGLSRRLVGSTPFTVNEIERIAEVLDIQVNELIGEAVA